MTRSSSAGADSVGRFLRNQRFRHQETRRIYAISCVRFSHLSANAPLVRRCPYRICRNGSAKSGRSGLFTWSAIGLDLWSIPGMVAGPWRDLHESVC